MVYVNLPAGQTVAKYFVRVDYGYFFKPVDNYLSTGQYSYIKGVPFTGRMPGYSVVYFLFRLLFDRKAAIFCVVGFQFLFSAISVYLMALTAYYIFNSSKCFYITYALYVLAIFPGFFDFFMVAESLSVSTLIFSLYYFVLYVNIAQKNKYLVLSGFFVAWTIFLREYTGILLPLFFIVIFFFWFIIKKEKKLFVIGKRLLLFCLPFTVAETMWVTRNYVATKQVILLDSSMEAAYGDLYAKSWQSLDNLVFTWGINASPFDNNSMGYYYRNPRNVSYPFFPNYIFEGISSYNKDSLVHLRSFYDAFFYGNDSIQKRKLDNRIVQLCEIYKQDYIAHHPFRYWIVKPLNNLRYLMLFSGTGYLPFPSYSDCTLLEKCIKLIFCALYYLILLGGAAGLLICCFIKRSKNFIPCLVLLMCLAIVLTLNFYSEIQEPRYFVQAFALLFPFAAYFINLLWAKIKKQV
jgi:hypothetical protein